VRGALRLLQERGVVTRVEDGRFVLAGLPATSDGITAAAGESEDADRLY
jgi:predicted transcriptional regulator of viral defense system